MNPILEHFSDGACVEIETTNGRVVGVVESRCLDATHNDDSLYGISLQMHISVRLKNGNVECFPANSIAFGATNDDRRSC